jgi:hypothetical protein
LLDDEDVDEIIEEIELILLLEAAAVEDEDDCEEELRWGMTICSNCWRLLIGVDWCEDRGPWDDDEDEDDCCGCEACEDEDEDALWDEDEPGGGANPLDFELLPGESPGPLLGLVKEPELG